MYFPALLCPLYPNRLRLSMGELWALATQHDRKVGWAPIWIPSSFLSLSLTILYLQKIRVGPWYFKQSMHVSQSLFCLPLSGRIISGLPPFIHGAPQYWAPPLFYLVVKKTAPLALYNTRTLVTRTKPPILFFDGHIN